MRWSKGWITASGVVSVVAAIGGAAIAVAGSGSPVSGSDPAGKEVCAGQPLPFTSTGGPAGVLSDRFPVGTTLRITNLTNSRSATIAVTGVSSSCAQLNGAAYEQLRSQDSGRSAESVLRRVRVEIIGNAPATTPSKQARVRATGVVGQVVCEGDSVGLSAVGGAPGAFSGQFPIGTLLRITNLDNAKQIAVRVAGVGSGCVVLNSAAFAQLGEPGQNLVKRTQIEIVNPR